MDVWSWKLKTKLECSSWRVHVVRLHNNQTRRAFDWLSLYVCWGFVFPQILLYLYFIRRNDNVSFKFNNELQYRTYTPATLTDFIYARTHEWTYGGCTSVIKYPPPPQQKKTPKQTRFDSNNQLCYTITYNRKNRTDTFIVKMNTCMVFKRYTCWLKFYIYDDQCTSPGVWTSYITSLCCHPC